MILGRMAVPFKRIKISIVVKLSALVAGSVVVTALAVNEVYMRGGNQILIDRSIEGLQEETGYFQAPLQGTIDALEDDVQLLAHTQSAMGIVRASQHGGNDPLDDSSTAELKQRLATTFTEMLRTRERYRRIRFIDADGLDLLRVERFGDRVERASEGGSKRAGEELYLRPALSVAPGEVYLGEPSLQRDEGRVIVPHALVQRAIVPIFDDKHKPFGLILINMDLGTILQKIRSGLPENRTLLVANASGDYLVNPDPARLYASDLGHDHRLQSDDPRLLKVIGDPKRDKATYVPEDARRGSVLAFRKFHFDARDPNNFLSIAVEAPYRDIVAATDSVSQRGLMFSAFVALVALVFGVWLLRLLIRPLNNVAAGVVRYRKGEKNIQLPTDSPDEIGILSREFAAMMAQKDDEDWIKESLVSVSRNLLGFKDLNGFAEALLQSLAPSVGAEVGALYISGSFTRRHSSHEPETLNLMSVYGYRRDASLPESFRWGEGLIGTCAVQRSRMLVSDIPAEYPRIASALGEAAPRQILFVPILFENYLVAVLELATLGSFTELQMTLLDQLSFNVGVIMNSINASMRTQELLEEARQTAEELQRSEEELKTQQEELEASNEEMEEKTKALEEQNGRIRQQSAELEQTKRVIEEKAAELELSNRYKSEFLANMSHELRTPLNSLLILSRGLANNEGGNLTAEQIEEACVIHSGGMELLSLINDILDLSKVEAGKITITPEDIQFAGIVKHMNEQFSPVAKEKGLTFRMRVGDDLPEVLHTDGQRVEQILKNLLSNAFKFTEKGSVTLDIQRAGDGVGLQRSSLIGRETVALTVTDTGIGINESKFKDIFEAFQQEDGSIDRHYGGTGLGLTIARKFAHLLGGEIHVQSKKGEGSTFTLYLPLDSASGRSSHGPRPTASASTPATDLRNVPRSAVKTFILDDRKSIGPNDKVLLIIEDDREFASTLIKIARKRGYRCLAAGDGKSGLILATEQPVTAIILDLRLPDIDGLCVLDQLKHDLKTRHIPVHIISGMTEADTASPLKKGAIGYLTKPVRIEDIDGAFARIESLLSSELKRVLVIEDDKKTQVAIESLLKQKNIEITNVGTGEAGLGQLKSGEFDCIILDLKLPDMTGIEWLSAVEKEFGSSAPPPTVIYTAKELTEEENRQLSRYTGSIVIKGASSSDRLLDEVTLFLHSIEATLSNDQKDMIRMHHDPDQALQNRTILLVDDDMRNTFALSKLLKKHGMNIVIADNGEMALEKLQSEKAIELVIMDIMMPVMDGYEAMREMRSRKAWQNMPIIALTARAMPEEQERCMEAGANDYLVKPVDIERLLTLLRVWLFRLEKAA
jgi:CheY-like chemotaxis protein/signal transduction histidine kinase